MLARMLIGLVVAVICALQPAAHAADAFPSRAVKVIVPGGTGSSFDIHARRHAQYLAAELGQPVVVENKPGAAGTLAIEAALQLPADGHTLIVASNGELGLARALGVPSRVDPAQFFTPVALMTVGTQVMYAAPQLGVSSVPELIRKAALPGANPISCGVANLGTGSHIACVQFGQKTGVPVKIVPYKSGGAALPDLAAGRIEIALATVGEALSFVQQGRIVPLGSFGNRPIPQLPQVRTMTQMGLDGLLIEGYFLYLVRKETPIEIQRRLHDAILTVSMRPDNLAVFDGLGAPYVPMTYDETQSYFAARQADWNRRGQESGIRIDQ